MLGNITAVNDIYMYKIAGSEAHVLGIFHDLQDYENIF